MLRVCYFLIKVIKTCKHSFLKFYECLTFDIRWTTFIHFRFIVSKVHFNVKYLSITATFFPLLRTLRTSYYSRVIYFNKHTFVWIKGRVVPMLSCFHLQYVFDEPQKVIRSMRRYLQLLDTIWDLKSVTINCREWDFKETEIFYIYTITGIWMSSTPCVNIIDVCRFNLACRFVETNMYDT